jgi:hypothetical protein
MRYLCLAIVLLMAPAGVAIAQGVTPPIGSESRPTMGATSGRAPPAQPALINASQNIDILRHRGPTGKPCLTIHGYARPHIVNPNLFDHMITATNGCPQLIRMGVCYNRTQQCISMEIPGRMFKEAVLGTMPSLKDFEYEFRERF